MTDVFLTFRFLNHFYLVCFFFSMRLLLRNFLLINCNTKKKCIFTQIYPYFFIVYVHSYSYVPLSLSLSLFFVLVSKIRSYRLHFKRQSFSFCSVILLRRPVIFHFTNAVIFLTLVRCWGSLSRISLFFFSARCCI